MDSFSLSSGPGLVVSLVGYIYWCYCGYRIAQRTNTPDAWMAFVPILNLFLALRVAKKPWWYFLLLLIPLVNIVVVIMIAIGIAKSCGKSTLVGVLLCIPLVQLFVVGHLAFGK